MKCNPNLNSTVVCRRDGNWKPLHLPTTNPKRELPRHLRPSFTLIYRIQTGKTLMNSQTLCHNFTSYALLVVFHTNFHEKLSLRIDFRSLESGFQLAVVCFDLALLFLCAFSASSRQSVHQKQQKWTRGDALLGTGAPPSGE